MNTNILSVLLHADFYERYTDFVSVWMMMNNLLKVTSTKSFVLYKMLKGARYYFIAKDGTYETDTWLIDFITSEDTKIFDKYRSKVNIITFLTAKKQILPNELTRMLKDFLY